MDNFNTFEQSKLNANQLNSFYNSFFQVTDIGIAFLDRNGTITEINKAFTQLSGYSAEELVGWKFIEFIAEANQKEISKFLENGQSSPNVAIVCYFNKKDINLPVELKISALSDETKVPLGFVVQIDNAVTLNETSKEPILNKQFKVELENTISKFATLIDNSRDVLYSIYYKDIRFEYLSPSVIELAGFTRDELLAMRPRQMLQIIHPDFRKKYIKYWTSLKQGIIRQNHTIEYKIRPKLGISRWLSDNHKVILNEQGEIVKLVGNIRDITDFKLVEEALNRSRDRLFKAIEATNEGMWDWRYPKNKIYFDARFYAMVGYESMEFPATTDEWMKRIHPDEVDQVKALLNQYINGKADQWLIEYRFLAKNGNWLWVLNRGKVFERDENGKPIRMVGTHSDISQRKMAEEELQKRNVELQTIYDQLQISEEKFRQLAENTQDVFWLRDEELIIYVNSSFDKVWGRNREEVIKNPSILKQWIHPEDQYLFNTWVPFSMFESQKFYVEQYRIVKPDGEVRWIWSRLFPVLNEKGQIYRLAGIASDITDQKLVEEALIAAKEKALESDHLKSAFLANISHEIRTPMNGIIGFAELLKDDNLTLENRVQYVNVITKSSEQLLHIIDDIIDISKIEANQLKINRSKVNIADLLSELLLFYGNEKVHMGKIEIEVKAEISLTLKNTTINTDESRLRQILMNLISNALKFTEKGEVKFGFTLHQGNFVEFFVTDTGIGIPPNRQSQIFKRFRQLEDTFTRRFGGTGLGLAICEGLVKLLGGKIWVKSEVNAGSTFYFTVPIGEDDSKGLNTRKETVTSGDYNWIGKTILVVEDDEINQEFLIAVLSPTNAIIIKSSTGEDAVATCAANKNIDLVLMDIRLPQMNGYEAFKIIRETNPSLPVIAQTAFAMTEDASRCLEYGFSDYISKPINRKNLLSMINRLLIGDANKNNRY